MTSLSHDRFDAERRAAREGALVHPRPDLATFAVSGSDRLAWLNGIVTQDVGKLPPKGGAYGLSVGKTGKILAEVWMQAAEGCVYVTVPRGQAEAVRDHFEHHFVMEDVEIGAVLDRGAIFVHGPLAKELVVEARVRGADAAMVDWTGRHDAAVVLAPEGQDDALLAALLARAGAAGARASEEAWEALRISWGLPRFGVDYDEGTLPQEASLERVAVSFSKGCYLGQETVFMLERRGYARKRLARLAIEGDEPLPAGVEITTPATVPVGEVTSVTPAFEGGGLVGLGYVKHKLASPGVDLVLAGRKVHVLGYAADPLPKP
jgi:folate-binding protein YgfZ